MAADTVVLGIIVGTLAAIVYSLRVLILLERRIARMDLNIESLTRKILAEELLIFFGIGENNYSRLKNELSILNRTQIQYNILGKIDKSFVILV